MRLRMQFGLRTLLIAVAVLGVAIPWGQHFFTYRRKAIEHAEEARQFAGAAWGKMRFGQPDPDGASYFWKLYSFHDELSRRYRRAAFSPWSRVVADQPPVESLASDPDSNSSLND